MATEPHRHVKAASRGGVLLWFETRLNEHAMCMSTRRGDPMRESLRLIYVWQKTRESGSRRPRALDDPQL